MTHLLRSISLQALALLACLLVPAVPAQAELLHGKGLLWQVEAPNGAKSHVLGTFHSTDPRVLELPAPVEKAFRDSKLAVFEIVLTPQDVRKLAEAAMLRNGRSLDQILGPDLFARTAAAVRGYGLPGAALSAFKPWGVFSILAAPPEEFLRQSRGMQPLDFGLQRLAQGSGKRVEALESPAEQVGVFESFSDAQQAEMLAATLDQHDQIERTYERMVKLYLARNVAGIHALSTELSSGIDPALEALWYDRLIDRRNFKMAKRAEAHLRQGKAFIAVGALHLPGEKGVLHLLEQRGFKVTRVY